MFEERYLLVFIFYLISLRGCMLEEQIPPLLAFIIYLVYIQLTLFIILHSELGCCGAVRRMRQLVS